MHTGGFPDDPYAFTIADVRTGKGHRRDKSKKKSKKKAGVKAGVATPTPKWAGVLGGLLLCHWLPWPNLDGVVIVRLVECPSTKMLNEKLIALRDAGVEAVGSAWWHAMLWMPPHEPVAPRSVWAFGNGGHLHDKILENAIISPAGMPCTVTHMPHCTHMLPPFWGVGNHPSVELRNRIMAAILHIKLAASLHVPLAQLPVPTIRVVLPRQSGSWPPGEHRIQLVEHHDAACLVATAMFWTQCQLVTLSSVEAGGNFVNVAAFVPQERQYLYQVCLAP